MTDFTMKTDADGVATITWDVAGKSMNVMSLAGFQLLSDLIDKALARAPGQPDYLHSAGHVLQGMGRLTKADDEVKTHPAQEVKHPIQIFAKAYGIEP